MKILIINGSPKNNGNTARALAEAEAIFAAQLDFAPSQTTPDIIAKAFTMV